MDTILTKPRYTPEDLLTMPDGDHFELVDGNLVEQTKGTKAVWIGGQIAYILETYCRAKKIGWVMPADASYQCFSLAPNKVRRPDVSLIVFGRLPEERLPQGHFRVAPDLAVEVVSPNDLMEEVGEKVEEYLGAGVPQVWVISPRNHTLTVYRPQGPVTKLAEQDELVGEGPLGGLRFHIRNVFPSAATTPVPIEKKT